MSDETKDPSTMTAAEAYRLKHQLGQSITWGNSGLNALQVQELTKLTAQDFARIRNQYKQNRTGVVFPTYILLALLVACIVVYFLFANGWPKGAALLVGGMCFMTLCERDGHRDGYMEGYENGHDEGIHRVLGIKPEEAAEMREFATQMKIDDMAVGNMNKREKEDHRGQETEA
jgi:hypothetical protein